MKSGISQLFLSLVKLGIGHNILHIVSSLEGKHPSLDEWKELQDLAMQQGLYAVVLDGIEKLPEQCRPSQTLLLEWIGEILQSYEYQYKAYQHVHAELAAFHREHQLKMMVLKGYACSLDWPKPNHRPCGDIDIWQFGKQKEADEILEKEKGIKVDNGEHHHTVFYWGDFMVENHYDIIMPTAVKSNMTIEPVLKELAMDDSYSVDIEGEKVYLPSPNLNALFLLRHMLMHFVAVGVSIRNLLDWGFFWEKHGKDVDVNWLNHLLKNYNMRDFFNIINAICVEDLGFDSGGVPTIQYNPFLKDRVLKEILEPEFDKKEAHLPNPIKRLVFKYKRWKGGAWKRDLCFKESMLSSFLWSVRSHLLKPRTI
jgi:hypothetical protein